MPIDPIRIESKARNNRLMVLREQMGMTRSEFAAYLGIGYSTYCAFENLSKFPSPFYVEKMSTLLGSAVEEAFPAYLRDVQNTTIVRTIPEEHILSLGDSQLKGLLAPAPDDGCTLVDMKRALATSICSLNHKKQEQVLCLYFGIDGGKEHTLREIGLIIRRSPERVRQLLNKALRRLRHPSHSTNLRPFLDETE